MSDYKFVNHGNSIPTSESFDENGFLKEEFKPKTHPADILEAADYIKQSK